MSSLGTEQPIILNSPAADINKRLENREGSAERKAAKERDDKLKVARERQNEERQRKIEELKAQAEAAQKYREQKEEERRRRMEEIRHRDSEKRQQVEERKKAIMEAERERREYILRKNQERESRLELKKRERSSIGYAFGSSTPRLLEPADFGMVSSSTFWGQRRSTSISNVAGVTTISRRSSERELNDSGIKKRATSASDNERHDEDSVANTSPIVFRSVARRKTDLMPTIPSPREGQFGSRSSLSTPRTPVGRAYSMNRLDQLAQPVRRNGEHIRAILERERREQMEMMDDNDLIVGDDDGVRRIKINKRKHGNSKGSRSVVNGDSMSRSMTHLASNSGSRSGNVTPGGHINANSRPGSAMSTSTTLSTTGFLNRRSTPMVRKPRPASIAGTGVSLEEMNKLKKEPRPPAKPSTAQTTPKRLSNLMSTSLIVSPSARLLTPEKKTTPFKKEVTISKASTSKIFPKSTSSDRLNKISKEKTIENDPKSPILTKRLVNGKNVTLSMDNKETNRKSKEEKEIINQVKTEESISTITVITVPDQPEVLNNIQTENGARNTVNSNITSQDEEKADIGSEKEKQSINVDSNNLNKLITDNNKIGAGSTVQELNISESDGCTDAMTASMIAKSKITTEEEAKAALAERRRLAREEAERQAELERQRIEAERLAELKRQEEEAERQRQFEEEAMRLAEEQRKAEEERLQQAIKEAKQREEMEKRKREEEERQRVEREEAEKKAKEEAEKQRIEVAERLKREEKEREERRKRVEAIMSRTRRSGTNSATPNSTPTKENHGTYTHKSTTEITNNVNATNDVTNATNSQEEEKNANSNSTMVTSINNSESNSTSSLSSVTTTTPTTSIESLIPGITTASSTTTTTTLFPNIQNNKSHIVAQNSQCMYEQSVINKENSLINCFSNLIINENAKNIQQQQQHQLQNQFMAEQAPHTIKLVEFQKNHEPVSNGNSNHIDIINKNECDLIKTVTIPSTNQLVDITMDSHDNINFKNNNSLLSPTTTTTTALVTADSHENKDISML